MRMQAMGGVVWKVIVGLIVVSVCSIFTGEGKDMLGFIYDNGYVVSQNYREAAKWYGKAAEQGDTHAQLELAIKYALGQGVPVSYVQALKWATIASKQHEQHEQRADEAQVAIEGHITKEDIAIGQYLAYLWM